MGDGGGPGGWFKWVVAGVLVLIIVALIGAGVLHLGPANVNPFNTGAPAASAEITLSRATAPRGAQVTIDCSGFQPGELVEIRVHVTTVGTATADSQGKFAQVITVPDSAPPPDFPTDISATGHSSVRTATAPFSTV
jgi:hypothetical protein